jgi:hypothetical protein
MALACHCIPTSFRADRGVWVQSWVHLTAERTLHVCFGETKRTEAHHVAKQVGAADTAGVS